MNETQVSEDMLGALSWDCMRALGHGYLRSSLNAPDLHLVPVGTKSPHPFGSGRHPEGHPLSEAVVCSPGKSQGEKQMLLRKVKGTTTPATGATPKAASTYNQMEDTDITPRLGQSQSGS